PSSTLPSYLPSFPTRRSSDLGRDLVDARQAGQAHGAHQLVFEDLEHAHHAVLAGRGQAPALEPAEGDHVGAEGDVFEDVATALQDRKSTRLNSSHEWISYAVF